MAVSYTHLDVYKRQPFNEREVARVLAPEGSLYTVVPGARHLFGLKEVLYDTPYLNDEKLPKLSLIHI